MSRFYANNDKYLEHFYSIMIELRVNFHFLFFLTVSGPILYPVHEAGMKSHSAVSISVLLMSVVSLHV